MKICLENLALLKTEKHHAPAEPDGQRGGRRLGGGRAWGRGVRRARLCAAVEVERRALPHLRARRLRRPAQGLRGA